MWDKVNTKESWWEKKTSREYGFEDRRAGARSYARSVSEMKTFDGSSGTSNMDNQKKQLRRQEQQEKAARQRAIRQLKSLQSSLRRKLASAEDALALATTKENQSAINAANREIKKLRGEVNEITKQLKKYGA